MKTLLSVIAICCMTPALEAMCEKTTLDKQFAMSDVVFTGRAIDLRGEPAASRPTLGTSACLPTGLIERAQPTLQWLAAKPRTVSR